MGEDRSSDDHAEGEWAMSVSGHLDVGIFLPQVTASFEEVLGRAEHVERVGLHSFWLYDHLYTPALPDRPALEAWTLATALLARTTTLRVGHLVLNNNFRHPALLAKMISTLDVISDGRLDVGIGSGSYAPEHEQLGMDWPSLGERSRQLGEALAVITAMLSGGTATFAGEHYQVTDVPNLPSAVQVPRPPIHVGGISVRHTLPLVARYADVWNVPTYGLVGWQERAAELDLLCESIDRDPAEVGRSHQAILVLAEDAAGLAAATERARRRYPGRMWALDAGGYVGTPSQLVDHMGAMIEQGVRRFVLLPADRAEHDMVDLLAERVVPHLTPPGA